MSMTWVKWLCGTECSNYIFRAINRFDFMQFVILLIGCSKFHVFMFAMPIA
jgi:hypothetical protein